jgi:hypothetical protein
MGIIKEPFSFLSGRIRIKTFDKNGKLKDDTGWKKNLIVNSSGLAMANVLAGVDDPTTTTKIALGTDNTAPLVTDTALGAEVQADTAPSLVASTNTWQVYGAIGPGFAGFYEELGLFVGTNMVSHVLTGTKEKAGEETVVVIWEVSF